jgi:transposase
MEVVIPRKANENVDGRMRFDREAYRRRNVVECCVGWLKECRRIAARFEKLAINFVAMIKLGMIQKCLRLAFSDSA